MKSSLVPQENQVQKDGANQMVKATSLLYLKEALINEAYEECAQLIAVAKDNGADQKEISEAIDAHIKTVKGRYGKQTYGFRKP